MKTLPEIERYLKDAGYSYVNITDCENNFIVNVQPAQYRDGRFQLGDYLRGLGCRVDQHYNWLDTEIAHCSKGKK